MSVPLSRGKNLIECTVALIVIEAAVGGISTERQLHVYCIFKMSTFKFYRPNFGETGE